MMLLPFDYKWRFRKAKSVLQELIGHHKDAEPSLAWVAYENYKKVRSLDKRKSISQSAFHLTRNTQIL